jgi:hypothetical protein
VGKGVFKPVFPVYAVAEEEEAQQFIVNAGASYAGAQTEAEQLESISKNYKVKVRNELSNAVFRGTVMRAYRAPVRRVLISAWTNVHEWNRTLPVSPLGLRSGCPGDSA